MHVRMADTVLMELIVLPVIVLSLTVDILQGKGALKVYYMLNDFIESAGEYTNVMIRIICFFHVHIRIYIYIK